MCIASLALTWECDWPSAKCWMDKALLAKPADQMPTSNTNHFGQRFLGLYKLISTTFYSVEDLLSGLRIVIANICRKSIIIIYFVELHGNGINKFILFLASIGFFRSKLCLET